MSIKAVIFDMDGVLIDSERHYYQSDSLLFTELGIPFGEKEAVALTGASYLDFPALVRSMNPAVKQSDSELMLMYADSLMNALVNDVDELIPGVYEWMERFRARGLKIAVGSASHAEMVRHVIEKFGLNVDAVVTGSDVSKGKPAPDIFLECAKRLAVLPDECLVIEDSQNGVNAAANAGMLCAAFLGTHRVGFDLSAANLSFNTYDDQSWVIVEALL